VILVCVCYEVDEVAGSVLKVAGVVCTIGKLLYSKEWFDVC